MGGHVANTEQTLCDEREIFSQYIAAHGLKLTRQREAILEAFCGADGHIGIEDLYAVVRIKDPRIGQATVYRTMKLLVNAGLAKEHHFGDGLTRYEQASHKHHHDHMICVDCNSIIEFEDEEIERLQEAAAKRLGFDMLDHKLELKVRCNSPETCRRDSR